MVILSTRNCYTGHNVVEDLWETGSIDSLEDNREVDNSSIEYSAEQWLSETEYFAGFMHEYISEFENRFHTEVIGVALVGTVGLWNGNKRGGDVYDISMLERILNMRGVDEVDVIVEDDRTITIRGSHHDGVHYMNIYLITKRRLMKAGYGKYATLSHILSYDKLGLLHHLSECYEPVKMPFGSCYFKMSRNKKKIVRTA